MNKRVIFIIVICVIYLIFSGIYLFAGTIHVDEGAYLYASKAVYSGKIPYRDFFFLQPPVYPYVYGAIQLLFPGFLIGRLTSVVFGLAAVGLMCLTAKRLGNYRAGLMTFTLVSTNLFQLYFFSISRLYALTTFFISLGCYFLVQEDRPRLKQSVLITLWFTLAVATRLTTLPMISLVIVYLAIKGRTKAARFTPVLVFSCVFSIVFGPIILQAGFDRLFFNILGLNLSLHAYNLTANLVQKARTTSQMIQSYFFFWILFVPIAVNFFRNSKLLQIRKRITSLLTPEGLLWMMAISTLILQMAGKIYQVSYQTIVMPMLFCLVSVEWTRIIQSFQENSLRILKIVFFTGCILSVLSYGRTSLSFPGGKPAYFALQEQADFVSKHSSMHDKIFTADTALVSFVADRDILTGMSASDLFCDWSNEKCTYYNVLNFDIMEEYVQHQRAAVLIHGDLSFTLSLPYLKNISQQKRNAFLDMIKQNYKFDRKFPNLFIPGTFTYYYTLKENP